MYPSGRLQFIFSLVSNFFWWNDIFANSKASVYVQTYPKCPYMFKHIQSACMYKFKHIQSVCIWLQDKCQLGACHRVTRAPQAMAITHWAPCADTTIGFAHSHHTIALYTHSSHHTDSRKTLQIWHQNGFAYDAWVVLERFPKEALKLQTVGQV